MTTLKTILEKFENEIQYWCEWGSCDFQRVDTAPCTCEPSREKLKSLLTEQITKLVNEIPCEEYECICPPKIKGGCNRCGANEVIKINQDFKKRVLNQE
jgi:hypothetical protein